MAPADLAGEAREEGRRARERRTGWGADTLVCASPRGRVVETRSEPGGPAAYLLVRRRGRVHVRRADTLAVRVMRCVARGPVALGEIASGAGDAERTVRRVRRLFVRGYLDALPGPPTEGFAGRILDSLAAEAPPVSLFEQGAAHLLRAVEAAHPDTGGGDPLLAAYRRDAVAAQLAAGARMACVEGSFRGWLEEYWRSGAEADRARVLAELAEVVGRVLGGPALFRAGYLDAPRTPGGAAR